MEKIIGNIKSIIGSCKLNTHCGSGLVIIRTLTDTIHQDIQ